MSAKSPVRDGLGVDRSGGPVIDPTANVIALNDAANKRQDDLREAHQRYVDSQIAHVKEIGQLRASHSKEISEIRSTYVREIRQMETDRVNSIRSVDVAGGEREAKRALDAVQALAATTQANTETLRNSVQATAQTIAKQSAETFEGVYTRLAALERSSYEGKGKEAVADPMMAQLVLEVKALAQSGNVGAGASKGMRDMWGWVAFAITIAIAIVGLYLRK